MMQDKIFFDSKSQIGIKKVPINSKRKFKFDDGGGVSGSVYVGDVGYLKRNKSSLATVVKVTPKLVYYTLAGTSKTKSLYKEDFIKSFKEVKGFGEKGPKKETVTISDTKKEFFPLDLTPSTNRNTWSAVYNTGDFVYARKDMADFIGVEFSGKSNVLKITQSFFEKDAKRPENPSGIMYTLKQVYGDRIFTLEGKDISDLIEENPEKEIDQTTQDVPKTATLFIELSDYRIKTKEELIKEFGDDYRSYVQWNSSGQMDYLFGQRLTDLASELQYESILDSVKNGNNFDLTNFTDFGPSSWNINFKAYIFDPIVEVSQSQTTDEVDYTQAFKLYNDTEFKNGVLQIKNPFTDASSRRDLKLAYDYSVKKGESRIDSEEDYITINDVDNIRSYLAFNMSYPQILEDIDGDQVVSSIKRIAMNYDLASTVVIRKLIENPEEGAQYNKAFNDLLQYRDAKSKLSGENSELIQKIDDKIEELSTEVSSLGLFSPRGYYETYFLMNQNNIDDLKILNKAIPFKPVFNFSLWFNGSVVVDEYGNPLEVYHGSKNEGFSNFKFDVFPGIYFAQKKSYSEWFARLGPNDTLFSCYLNVKNPIDLTTFGLDKVKYEEFVAYVELKYKYKLEENKALRAFSDARGGIWAWQYLRGGIDWLKQIIKDGVFDGLKFYENNPDDNSEGQENSTIAWMVFKPQQIKAASGNLLYSNYSDDIRFKKGGQL
jgi:hypothetical protein